MDEQPVSTRKQRVIKNDPRFDKKPEAVEALVEVKPPPKKPRKATKPKGGPIPVKTEEEQEKEEKHKADLKASKERIKKLNEYATFMLSCLEPGFCEDWKQAAQEQRVLDIGVYMLGVLNRLSKMVDYMETDIEVEWEQGLVGYNEHLFCEYCKKEIEIGNKTHLKQRFCTNLCAKRYNDAHTTGIIYPVNDRNGPDEAAIEEDKYIQEARREGVIV